MKDIPTPTERKALHDKYLLGKLNNSIQEDNKRNLFMYGYKPGSSLSVALRFIDKICKPDYLVH